MGAIVRLLGRVTTYLRGELALAPDLKHLDDGALRWRFGDDPGEGVDFGSVD